MQTFTNLGLLLAVSFFYFLFIIYDFISLSVLYMYVFHKFNEWFNSVTSKDMA